MTGPMESGGRDAAGSEKPPVPRRVAGTSHWVYGPTLRVCEELGESWTEIEAGPAFGGTHPSGLQRIGQIVPGLVTRPGTSLNDLEDEPRS